MSECIEYKGLSVVHGIVIAPILIVDESTLSLNFEDVVGKIAVIRIASPSIVLWLRRAAGLVVEKGGITSHGAILAREFNIPAIVGISGIFDPSLNGKLGELRSADGILRIW